MAIPRFSEKQRVCARIARRAVAATIGMQCHVHVTERRTGGLCVCVSNRAGGIWTIKEHRVRKDEIKSSMSG